ncbi:UPF0472 protein C16orf72 homolog isoform X2 [Chrysoperla carnea]|uniref:UPF0472 protein C16orf72 homolog isoform X2 n=1 Tax=Chrysoperla carnea TaxID=189513 RepID=UPI001D080C54|nr:UPF0472 protein C16orf72 homolog isoform X2 [Chrysoperla carnea]
MNPNDEDSWFSQWEQQCETQGPDLDQEYANEQESCRTFLFGHFQESAGAIGHLYAEKRLPEVDDPSALWTAFRLAAESVTGLYRASVESLKRSGEAGISMGHARRSRELIGWVRKHRRPHIRKDDLLAYLTGKPLPPPHARSFHRTSPRSWNISPTPVTVDTESNLDMFNEALATTQLTTTTIPRQTGRSPQRAVPSATGELCAFIASEIARHRKRPAPSSSPADVTMDSPTHHNSKRQRYM